MSHTGCFGYRSEVEIVSFNVYPNPSEGKLTVELETNTEQITEVEVLDLTGRIVYVKHGEFYNNKEEIELPSDLLGGVYILRVKQQNSVTTKNILLNR